MTAARGFLAKHGGTHPSLVRIWMRVPWLPIVSRSSESGNISDVGISATTTQHVSQIENAYWRQDGQLTTSLAVYFERAVAANLQQNHTVL